MPIGDPLIHASNLAQVGSFEELRSTLDRLKDLSHPHKIVIAGNQNIPLESEDKAYLDWTGLRYLQDSSTNIRFLGGHTLKVSQVYGSVWIPTPGAWAFQYPRTKNIWSSTILHDTDILVTHRPPRFHLDGAGFGDENLL